MMEDKRKPSQSGEIKRPKRPNISAGTGEVPPGVLFQKIGKEGVTQPTGNPSGPIAPPGTFGAGLEAMEKEDARRKAIAARAEQLRRGEDPQQQQIDAYAAKLLKEAGGTPPPSYEELKEQVTAAEDKTRTQEIRAVTAEGRAKQLGTALEDTSAALREANNEKGGLRKTLAEKAGEVADLQGRLTDEERKRKAAEGEVSEYQAALKKITDLYVTESDRKEAAERRASTAEGQVDSLTFKLGRARDESGRFRTALTKERLAKNDAILAATAEKNRANTASAKATAAETRANNEKARADRAEAKVRSLQGQKGVPDEKDPHVILGIMPSMLEGLTHAEVAKRLEAFQRMHATALHPSTEISGRPRTQEKRERDEERFKEITDAVYKLKKDPRYQDPK